ncbi:MAG TPA: peptide deformylase [Acidobacteriota bacterium]
MAQREILKYPAPALREKARRVERFDAELRRLAEDLMETLYQAGGVGLAANQIGELKRIILVDPSAGREPGRLHVLVNPEVVAVQGEIRAEEGCLSFPQIVEVISRPAQVEIKAQDLQGNAISVQCSELLARILHHEIDHLDGVLFIDRMSRLKRRLVLQRIHKRIRLGSW